jgi:hypothetical protein
VSAGIPVRPCLSGFDPNTEPSQATSRSSLTKSQGTPVDANTLADPPAEVPANLSLLAWWIRPNQSAQRQSKSKSKSLHATSLDAELVA